MSEHGAIYTEVPTNSRPNKPTALQHVGDFANMVKAFIGSNYLALPFAFSQSGLGFGLGGLLIIVAMTDYCCQLLVKVKHIVVNNIVDTKRIQEKIERASSIANASTSSSSSSFTSSSPAASNTAEEDELAIHAFHQQVAKSLSYQDIGRIVFGTPGSVIVQMCLLLTQFGFCIGYFVFLGNTIYSMFPVKIVETNSSMPDINVTQSLPQLVTVLPGLSTSTSESIQNGSMGFYSTRSSLNSQVYSKPKTETIRISSTVSATTQAYQPTSLGTTRTPNTQGTQTTFTTFTTPKNFNSSDNSEHQTIMSNSSEISHLLEMTEGKEGIILTDANSSMVAGSSPSYVSDDNVNDTTSDSSIKAGGNFSVVNGSSSETFTQNSNSSDSFTQNRTKRFVENIDDRRVTIPIYLPQETMSSLTSSATIGNQTVISTAPALQYLVLVPGPVFIFFSWIRHVRSMGPISLIANLAIFAGFVSVLCYLIVGFTVSESVVWFKLETFPIFFGQVTTAYEGIGLIIPIESSMENNRHSFASFLHGAVFLVSLVLGTFGILGYLRYGDATDQMINQNLEPQHSPLTLLVSATLCVGILFTFPLQLMPVIEITEGYLFAEGKICGPSTDTDEEEKGEEESERDDASLLPGVKVSKSEVPAHVSVHIPASVSAWKRNLWRTCLVLCCAGFAVLLRAKFAYIGAFIGSVGGTVLMYILPCICHLKLSWHRLPAIRIALEICITVLGTAGGSMGLYAVIRDMVMTLS